MAMLLCNPRDGGSHLVTMRGGQKGEQKRWQEPGEWLALQNLRVNILWEPSISWDLLACEMNFL